MKKEVLSLLVAAALSTTLFAQKMPEMVKVKGGTFTMGDESGTGQADELPLHQVTLKDFSMAKTETTVLQWKAFCEATKKAMPAAPESGWTDNHPISNITWQDATDYTKWLSATTGRTYRLPTEAEWEFAARGGILSKGYLYSGGKKADSVAWHACNSVNQSHPVAQKKPNELGLYDMTGNVWEWCNDFYEEYTAAAVVNPTGAIAGIRLFRGGGLVEPDQYIRIAIRGSSEDDGYAYRDLGFRVVSID